MKNIIVLMAGLILLSSCQRKTSDSTSQVEILLPKMTSEANNEATSKTTVGIFSSMDLPEADDGIVIPLPMAPDDLLEEDWLPFEPTGYSGAAPVNCYMVVATDQDASLVQVNYCSLKGVEQFRFSHFDGPVPLSSTASNSLTLTLPVNRSYVFRLLAVHAETATDCKRIIDGIDKSDITKPYVVATSSATTINSPSSSTVQTVQLNMESTFPASSYVDDCEFKKPLLLNPDLSSPANILVIKDEFPAGLIDQATSPAPSVCYPLSVLILNPKGYPISLTSSRNIELAYYNSAIDCGQDMVNCPSATWTVKSSYSSQHDCIADTSGTAGSSSFSFPTGVFKHQRWVKSEIQLTEWDYFKGISSDFAIAASEAIHRPLRAKPETSRMIDVVGPMRVLEDQCLMLSLSLRMVNGSPITLGSRTFEVDFSDTDAGYFATKADCLNNTNKNPAAGFSTAFTNALERIYLKFKATASPIEVKVSQMGGTEIMPSKYYVNATIGPTLPKKLNIIGNKSNLYTGQCLGPFQVTLQNDLSATVALAVGDLLRITLSASNANVSLYTASSSSGTGCTGTPINGSLQTVQGSSSSASAFVFYMSSSSTTAADFSVSVTGTHNNATLEPSTRSFYLYGGAKP